MTRTHEIAVAVALVLVCGCGAEINPHLRPHVPVLQHRGTCSGTYTLTVHDSRENLPDIRKDYADSPADQVVGVRHRGSGLIRHDDPILMEPEAAYTKFVAGLMDAYLASHGMHRSQGPADYNVDVSVQRFWTENEIGFTSVTIPGKIAWAMTVTSTKTNGRLERRFEGAAEGEGPASSTEAFTDAIEKAIAKAILSVNQQGPPCPR